MASVNLNSRVAQRTPPIRPAQSTPVPPPVAPPPVYEANIQIDAKGFPIVVDYRAETLKKLTDLVRTELLDTVSGTGRGQVERVISDSVYFPNNRSIELTKLLKPAPQPLLVPNVANFETQWRQLSDNESLLSPIDMKTNRTYKEITDAGEAIRSYPYVVSHYGSRLAGGINAKPGNQTQEFHGGVDISMPVGTPLRAPEGFLIYAGNIRNDNPDKKQAFQGLVGTTIVLTKTKGGPALVLYGHQSSIEQSAGQWLKEGTIIGKSGSTGNSRGPHLHLTVLQLPEPYKSNPEKLKELVKLSNKPKELTDLLSSIMKSDPRNHSVDPALYYPDLRVPNTRQSQSLPDNNQPGNHLACCAQPGMPPDVFQQVSSQHEQTLLAQAADSSPQPSTG